jgi:hypothetical protein
MMKNLKTVSLICLISALSVQLIAASKVNAQPGFGILKDMIPCRGVDRTESFYDLRQRVPYRLQFSPSKAASYCKNKYGREAIVINKLGLSFCATPEQASA